MTLGCKEDGEEVEDGKRFLSCCLVEWYGCIVGRFRAKVPFGGL